MNTSSTITPHPWSRNFSWMSPPRLAGRMSEAQIGEFENDGVVILRGVIPQAAIAEVREACDRLEEEFVNELAAAGGSNGISEVGSASFAVKLVARSARLRSFSIDALFVDLCLDLLGADVNLYWDQLVYKKPEKPRKFPWHQDNGYVFIEPQQYLTCWIPLTEATPENGCPQVAARLHRLGTLQHHYVNPLGWECFDEAPGEVVVAAVSPGDVVVFSSLSPHFTGPNQTDAVRKAYILQYARADANVLKGDPTLGPPIERVPCNDPATQYPVTRDGRLVASSEATAPYPGLLS